MGLAPAVVPLVAALVVVWPSTRCSVATGVPLEGTSLLEVTSLDTLRIAARLADAGALGPMTWRRAGLFMVAVVDRQLVPVDEEEEDGARSTWLERAGRILFTMHRIHGRDLTCARMHYTL
jgi:hypothetical protein